MKDKIKIITDSTCDLPDYILSEYAIDFAPLKVAFSQEEYRERVDLSPREFYEKLKNSDNNPTTSQPSPGDFINIYSRAIEEGYNKIISIHISCELSGTVHAANMASSELEKDIEIAVIDSKNTSLGLGFLALKAAMLTGQEKEFDQIVEIVYAQREKIEFYFMVDSLDYLERGGRVGKAKALTGKLLDYKPVLILKDGIVCPVKNIKGKDKAIEHISNLIEKHIKASPQARFLGILHSDSSYDVNTLLNLSKKYSNSVQTISTELGCVVGSHVGPGAIGVVVL